MSGIVKNKQTLGESENSFEDDEDLEDLMVCYSTQQSTKNEEDFGEDNLIEEDFDDDNLIEDYMQAYSTQSNCANKIKSLDDGLKIEDKMEDLWEDEDIFQEALDKIDYISPSKSNNHNESNQIVHNVEDKKSKVSLLEQVFGTNTDQNISKSIMSSNTSPVNGDSFDLEALMEETFDYELENMVKNGVDINKTSTENMLANFEERSMVPKHINKESSKKKDDISQDRSMIPKHINKESSKKTDDLSQLIEDFPSFNNPIETSTEKKPFYEHSSVKFSDQHKLIEAPKIVNNAKKVLGLQKKEYTFDPKFTSTQLPYINFEQQNINNTHILKRSDILNVPHIEERKQQQEIQNKVKLNLLDKTIQLLSMEMNEKQFEPIITSTQLQGTNLKLRQTHLANIFKRPEIFKRQQYIKERKPSLDKAGDPVKDSKKTLKPKPSLFHTTTRRWRQIKCGKIPLEQTEKPTKPPAKIRF